MKDTKMCEKGGAISKNQPPRSSTGIGVEGRCTVFMHVNFGTSKVF